MKWMQWATLFIFANVVSAARLRSSRQQGHCDNLGVELCRIGSVSVMRSHTGNRRLLRFGEECATETKVDCVGQLQQGEGSCDSSCGDCPCEFDASGQLSASYMRTMFEQLMDRCSEDAPKMKALMIGLGGGELPQYLLRKCPNLSLEVVELSADVITVAKRFFGLSDSEQRFGTRLAVQQTDGFSAVEQRANASSGSYGAVIVDCFAGGGEVPEGCRSERFVSLVHQLLQPQGVLLQNIWHYSPERPQVAEQFKETVGAYKASFHEVQDLTVPMPPHIQWVDVLRGDKSVADM